jgi:hypothetical protein
MTHAHLSIMLANRQPHEERAGVKYRTLESAVAEFTAMVDRLEQAETRLARCTCDYAPGFEINVRCERPWTYPLNLRNQRRMAAEAA